MSRNSGESRIPLPRTVRPSLLPKLQRSLGTPKIGSVNHRRHSPSSVYCTATPNNKLQQQPHYVFGRLHQAKSNKQLNEHSPAEPNKEDCLSLSEQADLSIWDVTKDNKDAELLMRLSNEQLSLFRSQEELAQEDASCLKRRQPSLEEFDLAVGANRPPAAAHEEASLKLESPLAAAAAQPPHYLMLQTKQNSFEHDESSLGILTPDQMTDFTVALESSRTPSCENLSTRDPAGNFLLSKSNALVAAAARHLDIVASVPTPISPNDRSPSFEDLPLDPRPVLVVNNNNNNDDEDSSSLCAEDEAALAKSSLSAKTSSSAPDSTETSAAKPLPTSFVTSVTSITSLEAGYQGDGENSRPASRGPEPLALLPAATAGLVVGGGLGTHLERNPVSCKQDPMTDSDFFTESDADEVVRGAGDRRAQVIDGTLFCAQPATDRRGGGPNGGFEPAEEMDSSGIYSDLDKRQDSSGLDLEPEPEESYGDGDHATDTADTGDTGDTGDTEISVRSQPSPQESTPAPALVTNNMLTPDVLNDTFGSNSTASTAEVTVIKCQKNEQNAATRTKSNSFSNKENSAPLKKYKMPKRNVISKIKTMIEANQNLAKEETESEPKRSHRQQRKNGRWDAVMTKIEAGKQRGRALKKEVKSRVLQGLPNSTTSSTASTSSTRRGTVDTTSSNKDKRRMRGRPETSSNQELARTSSLRSSASDLSSTHSKETLKRPTRKTCAEVPTQLHQPNNNQISTNLTKSKSNLSATVRKTPSIKSVQSVNVKQKNTTTNRVTERVQPPRAQSKQLANHINNNNNNNNNNHHNSHQQQENESNNNNNNNNVVVVDGGCNGGVDIKVRVESREQQVQTEGQPQDWSKRAEDTVQALAITVQYFTHQLQLEDLAGSRLRQQLDAMKTEWRTTSSELEELRLDKAGVEQALNHERDQHLHRLQNLTHELEQERAQRSGLEKRLQEERRQIERLQGLLEERQREEKVLRERLQTEHELQLSRVASNGQQQQDTRDVLAAEVESLRTVLEIRSQENSQLRAEVDLLRRELDDKEQVRLKCDSLEARCEDLKAQLLAKEENDRQLAHENEKLLASIHQLSKQNKRLSQRNEELLWRLRQKNEVVSVLTNQLTPQSQQRLSKSLQPSSSNSQLETSTCSMKYMVEKGDSVSWTLDISDSFETCHSQSFALSNSSSSSCCSSARRHTSSASNGVHGANRARSNSASVVDRPAKSAKTSLSHAEEQAAAAWKPSYQSTPLTRRRNDHSWSLSNTLTETVSSQTAPKLPNSAKAVAALQVVSTDDDEEDEAEQRERHDHEVESLGQRPQEAGGEAMISEETSTSSSSEDDESSVSSGDIP